MTSEFIDYTTHLRVRMQPSRMRHVLRKLGALLGSRSQLQAGDQPDWARVPGRVWRRRSMLLTTLHEMRGGAGHD